ncbi:MAG: twin-arginine translocase TatA/TatE family subunit [Anaerolineales bacterium]|jgi:sec-independent protein translocase protein TatA|nr:twin-arginine translocase TatA/TatE family subunit [Anaerolineales bacterium]NOR83654.1 twin-arginine translocase TatA/TatE family subunit [Ardenticatenales bacterium]
MFRQLGPTELLIILGIVVLLFGVGRLSKIGSELGQGIRAFKDGLKSDEDVEVDESEVVEPETAR